MKIYEVIDTGIDGWTRRSVGFFLHKEDAIRIRDTKTSWGKGRVEEHELHPNLLSFDDRLDTEPTKEELELLDRLGF